jgi:hypothetical protein
MVCFALVLLLFSSASAQTQISPNPNYDTITITDANTNAESFDNYGTIQIESTGSLDNSDSLYNWWEIINIGTLTNFGTIDNDNTLNNFGSFSNSQTFLNHSFGIFNNKTDGSMKNFSAFDNAGTIINDSGGTIENDGYINNIGSIENSGKLQNKDIIYNSGTFNNYSTLQNNGTFYNTYDGATGTFNNEGIYQGAGTFVGNLDSGIGTIAPGNSAGTMTVEGNFLLSTDGTLEIVIGGFEDGEYDFLDITGSASLTDGQISFSFLDGYDISADVLPGQTETLMFLEADEGIVAFLSSVNFEFLGTPAGFVYDVYSIGNTTLWFSAENTNAIPAPGVLLLSCMGIGCISRLRRGRKI